MKKSRSSVTLKIIILTVLTLLLLIPPLFVINLIQERQDRSDGVKLEISSKWGTNKTINGPVISVPYKKWTTSQGGKKTYSVHYLHILPESLMVKSNMTPEKRYRGIYESVVYNADVQINGEFVIPDLQLAGLNDDEVMWEDAQLYFGVSDMRGIKNKIIINWQGKEINANPGIETEQIYEKGFGVKGLFEGKQETAAKFNFSTSININGSESLMFTPVGKSTFVEITSSWDTPSFTGNFLPRERSITSDGFTASWEVFHLNREFPQFWADAKYYPQKSEFGVELKIPVDHYQKAMRTTKYAIMFIGLTFLAFFMIEIMNRLNVHPIQYLLTGFALIIFYTLLLSISEYLNFTFSYIIAALAIIVQISLYSLSIFKEKSRALVVSGVLLMLYSYLFVVLQLEDFALLLGSVGLFTILGVVMYLTRKIDWSNITQQPENEETPVDK
ncbi:MAG: cell envelope integrity protein CreD [Melioribacteraceae bacterium]|nr:MAG: cell envelope integrity protein CreD [Melioribacteraceae bacterium]